jgi:hypothetical protein
MDDTELRNTLQRLAHYVVRNEIVYEYFLTQALPVTGNEIGSKVREVDTQLTQHTNWQQNRFPGLFR